MAGALSSATEQRAVEDFRVFLYLIWKRLGLPDPTPVQYEIAEYLQHGPKRRIVQAFRGVGKSWITSAYVDWNGWAEHTRRGKIDSRTLVVSAAKDRADAFSIFTKRLLDEVEWLRPLQPDARHGDRDSNVAFDFRGAPPAHAPSVKSVGVMGQMTGSRADKIIGDDIEIPNNSETATMREKLRTRWTETGGAILSPGGDVILLGTAQTEETIYWKLVEEHGYDMRVWPARVPEVGKIAVYQGKLAPSIETSEEPPGTPTDPKRFDEIELGERELEYGTAGFALQFMLDTSLSDEQRYPLKCRDFLVMDIDHEVAPERLTWASDDGNRIEMFGNPGLAGDGFYQPMYRAEHHQPYAERVMYVDPSGRGHDEVGYAVGYQLNGMIFVPAWGGLDGGHDDETLVKLATIARDHKVNVVMVEANFGDGAWTRVFEPVLRRVYVTKDGHGCAVEEEKVHGQKEPRIIDRLEPALSTHRLVLDKELVRQALKPKVGLGADAVLKSNFYQLTRLTRDRGALKHDDRIEALAGLVNYFVMALGIDTRGAAKQSRADRREEELRKFVERATKRSVRHRTWSDRL